MKKDVAIEIARVIIEAQIAINKEVAAGQTRQDRPATTANTPAKTGDMEIVPRQKG